MRVWSVGPEDPLEEGMATDSSILAWRISWTEEPAGLLSTGLQRVRHSWSNLAQHNLKEVTPFESQVFLVLNGDNNTWLYLYNRVLHVKSASFISNDTCWEESSLSLGCGERELLLTVQKLKQGDLEVDGKGEEWENKCIKKWPRLYPSASQWKRKQTIQQQTSVLKKGNGPFEAAKNGTCSSIWSLRDVYYQCFGHTLSLT